MKNIKIASASAIALGLAFAGAASAQSVGSGTIYFDGSVTDNTCTVQGGPGTGGEVTNFTVRLDSVPTTALTAAGATAGAKTFGVILGGAGSGTCNVAGVYSFALDNSSINIDADTGALKNASGENPTTQLQLLDAAGAPINLFNPYSVNFPALVNNQAQINFGVRYLTKGGAATAGAVESNVKYVLTYN